MHRFNLSVVVHLAVHFLAAASTDPAPAFLAGRPRHISQVAFRSSPVETFSSSGGNDEEDVHSTTTTKIMTADRTAENTHRSLPRTEESLYSTAYAMACASTLVYRYATLLRQDSELNALLEPPISVDRAIYLVLDNIEALFNICSKEDAKNVLQTLHSLRKGRGEAKATEWVEFEDPSSKKECAYGILVNHELKRCTIVFRGSDNNNDYVQDGKIPMVKRNNPVRGLRDQVGPILLHKGFDEYLFSRGNKVNQIIYKVKPYVREGYSLCFTGHSLGGALATIAGLYAASATAELRLSSPVQVYTFGSPRVGDKAFYDAFVHLESRNKIRHARFHNRMDLVARSPSHAPPPNMIRYAHVGMDITLQADKPPKLTYAPSIKDEDGAMKALLRSESFQAAEFSRFPAAGSVGGVVSKGMYHDVATYLERIKKLQQQETDPASFEETYQSMMREKG